MVTEPADYASGNQDPMPIPLLLEGRRATVAGAVWIDPTADPHGRPLVIGLHGGGFGRGYFLGLHPLPAAAAAHGADTVLLDRPGAGESRLLVREGGILADNAAALDEAVAALWDRHGKGRPGVFLIGHSIGGAIALLLAARRSGWPLVGISVSGIAQDPPGTMPFTSADDAAPVQPPLPRPALAHIMMAPGAANDAALDALQAASVPAVTEELMAIYTEWPSVIDDTFKAIDRPVQLIVAEHDPLWTVDAEAIDRLRRLDAGGRYEIVRWPDVGHCIDYHADAPRFYDATFTFMAECLADG